MYIRNDTNRALRKLIAEAGLNPYRTEAVELMFLDGEERTEQEVSEMLDLSRGAISLRYLAAKKDLKKYCGRQGVAESDY